MNNARLRMFARAAVIAALYTVLTLAIPVASYGQIARLIGREKNARLVGKVLSQAEYYGSYPCHRVVNHAGRTAPGWTEQRSLLVAEGVGFCENGRVDLKHFLWEC